MCIDNLSCDALIYPILNPHGVSRYRNAISLYIPQRAQSADAETNDSRHEGRGGGGATGGTQQGVSKGEFCSYDLMFRTQQSSKRSRQPALPCKKSRSSRGTFFQQRVVNRGPQIQGQRLSYGQHHQNDMCTHVYEGFRDALYAGNNPRDCRS